MAVLDTSVLIDLSRGSRNRFRAAAVRELASIRARGEIVATTRVNVAELFVGVELSDDPRKERATVEALLADLTIYELDELAAEHFGVVASHLQRLGTPSGDLDTLIATIAIVNGQELLTRNAKHFRNMPGLMLRSY